jgi:hypothetical protein
MTCGNNIVIGTDEPLASTDPTTYYGGFWVWQTFLSCIFCTWYGWLPIVGKRAHDINGQPLKWSCCCINRRLSRGHYRVAAELRSPTIMKQSFRQQRSPQTTSTPSAANASHVTTALSVGHKSLPINHASSRIVAAPSALPSTLPSSSSGHHHNNSRGWPPTAPTTGTSITINHNNKQ